jgi:signal transduction histidine kinase
MASTQPVSSMVAVRPRSTRPSVMRAVVVAPFTPVALRELLFCAIGVAGALAGIGALFGIPLATITIAHLVSGRAVSGAAPDQAEPPAVPAALAVVQIALLVLLVLAPRLARGMGAVQRRLAGALLGEVIPAPPPVPHRGWGPVGWVAGGLRDAAGWRALAYLLLKLPIAVFDGYAVFCWVFGLVNLTYPFWWRLFRNHPPQVHLDPVPVATPFGSFQVATFPGTLAAFAAGTAMILAAPWIARAVDTADRALMRALLGPGRLAQRVRVLEQTRAQAVDDGAALLRRVERDLHDGAQVRLAALALNLGRAREQLGDHGDPADLGKARELIDGAHRSAKDALAELRDLVRGIHPPVLDNGLADALATLAANSATPVRLATDIPIRPSPAIETIAYFSVAELMANAAKHSHANTVTVDATQHHDVLRLCISDDGVGGADPARGSGLRGLATRIRTVDGRLHIDSPPGGPTRITIQLPVRA